MRSSFFAARVCFWRDTFGFAKRVCFWRARVCFCSKGIFPSGLVYFIIFHQIFHRFRNSVLILPLPSSFIIPPFCSFSLGTIFLSARFPLISASPFCSFSPGTKFLLVLTWRPFSARSHLAQISCFSLWLSARFHRGFSAAECAPIARGRNVLGSGDNRATQARRIGKECAAVVYGQQRFLCVCCDR